MNLIKQKNIYVFCKNVKSKFEITIKLTDYSLNEYFNYLA